MQRTFLATAIAAVLSHAAPATAQQTDDNSADTAMEEIVVVGSRLQQVKAIDARRDSKAIVDAVTSDDVGRLPDFNIGEALQRLPGIGIQNDQAEARFVTIRALNAEYNYTTVDGVSIAVPDRDGRRVFMDVLPASLAERIDVYKTFTPNLEGGAIGGVIDIRTASAFNQQPQTFRFNGELGQYENNDGFRDVGPSGNADAFYATTFGESNQYGVVLSANYYKRDSTIPQAEWGSTKGFFNDDGSSAGKPVDGQYPGNGYAVPTERRGFFYHNDRTRYGSTVKLEAKPNSDSYFFVRGFWNTAKDDEARQTDLLRLSVNDVNTIVDQTATSGTIFSANGLEQRHYLGQFDFERSVWALTGGADYQLGTGELKLRLNYSGAEFSNPEHWIEWRMKGDNNGDGIDDNAFHYTQRDGMYFFEFLDPAANRDFSQFAANRRQFDDRSLDEDLYEVKLDWQDSLGSSFNWSYQAGLGYRQVDRSFDEERDRYDPTTLNTYDLASAGVVNDNLCLQPPGHGADQCLVIIDPELANSSWADHIAANPEQWQLNPLSNDDNRLDYSLTEDVLSAYAMLNYANAATEVTFGLRYEDTQVDGIGRRNVSGSGWTDVASSGGYNNLLPSLNLSHYLSENLLLRAGISESISRPSFNKIAPKGESFDPISLTLSRSNPNLNPREATNYDLGLDWYFDDGEGLVAANLFFKTIDGEIYTQTESIDMVVDGVSEQVDVTQPVNSPRTTYVRGVEMQFIKPLDSIFQGLGLSMNATLLDTDFQYQASDDTFYTLETMIGQPDRSFNTALYYDGMNYSLRLAYNYQSMRASARLYGDNYRNRFDGERDTLDFKASYHFSDALSFSLNLWNITGEGRTEWQGFHQELPMVAADFGRAVFVGVSYSY